MTPHHPLLKDIVETADKFGWGMVHLSFFGGQERAQFWPEPNFPNGVPCHDPRTNTWDSVVEEDRANIVFVGIDQSGHLFVVQGDDPDHGCFLETLVQSGGELQELWDFVLKCRISMPGKRKWQSRPLSSLLQGIFITVMQEDTCLLYPFDSKFMECVAAVATKQDYFWWTPRGWGRLSDKDYVAWPAWASENRHTESFREQSSPKSTDLVLGEDGTLRPLSQQLWKNNSLRWEPALVFRPKSEVSAAYLSDYFSHMSEGAVFVNWQRDWSTILQKIDATLVEMPTTKEEQIAWTVEFRSAKERYVSRIQDLMNLREPIRLASSIYQKRERALDLLHSARLDELEALKSPLPLFLEYPLRKFMRADDTMEKVNRGQQLLNALVKMPLYLIAEELQTLGYAPALELLSTLKSSPASEGKCLELRRGLDAAWKTWDAPPELKIFKGLQPYLKPGPELEELVAARNRFHHPPFDEKPFLTLMDKHVNTLAAHLRQALRGTSMVIPLSSQFIDGEHVVSAYNVCHLDPECPKIQFATKADLRAFPTGILVAYSEATQSTVPLNHWFSAKVYTRTAYDLGVFDRMRGGEAMFSYLISGEGNPGA